MSLHAVRAIYVVELARNWTTPLPSILAPIISSALYFVVFGAALGAQIQDVGTLSYGAFIVPGLIMLTLLTDTISNASFGIFTSKFTGTVYELLSAPISASEIVFGYVAAAATKAMIVGLLILATARLFIPFTIVNPVGMVAFLLLICITFSVFGFVLGLWCREWSRLNTVPMLIVAPLAFLGGCFYSVSALPPSWRAVALLDPVLYIVSGLRWSFYGITDVSIASSIFVVLALLASFLTCASWLLQTGRNLKP